MKKSMIILLIVAASLVLAGLVLCVIGLILASGTFSLGKAVISFGTRNFEAKEYEFSEEITAVDLTTNTTDVQILPATDGVTRVVCQEEANHPHEVLVEDGALIVRRLPTKWYENISFFSFGEWKVTVYLANPALTGLSVTTDTGDISVSQEISAENATIKASTGKIRVAASVTETLNIAASTGDVTLYGDRFFGSVNIEVSTGDVSLSGGSAADVKVKTSTGEIEMESFACASLWVKSTTGEQDYERVSVEGAMTLASTTGDISIEGCDTAEATITTDTGDVEGRFSSEMIFFAHTDTGRVRVPKSTLGGSCEITTDTGDIEFFAP